MQVHEEKPKDLKELTDQEVGEGPMKIAHLGNFWQTSLGDISAHRRHHVSLLDCNAFSHNRRGQGRLEGIAAQLARSSQ